jgi:hypothetical protein
MKVRSLTVSGVASLVALAGCAMSSAPTADAGAVPDAAPVRDASPPPSTCRSLGSWTSNPGLHARRTTIPQGSDTRFWIALGDTGVRPVLGVIAWGDASRLTGPTVDLGRGDNANFETCTHCVLVYLDCTTTNGQIAACASGPYFARAGTARFDFVPRADGDRFQGELTDVELEPVTIDDATARSRPVPGGDCVRLPSYLFDAIAHDATSGPSNGLAEEIAGCGGPRP